jgi:hypothetical protein
MQANESSLSEVVQILPVMILVFLLMGVFLYIKIATENRRNRVLRRDDHSLDTHGLARILNRLERVRRYQPEFERELRMGRASGWRYGCQSRHDWRDDSAVWLEAQSVPVFV